MSIPKVRYHRDGSVTLSDRPSTTVAQWKKVPGRPGQVDGSFLIWPVGRYDRAIDFSPRRLADERVREMAADVGGAA